MVCTEFTIWVLLKWALIIFVVLYAVAWIHNKLTDYP